jgi:hypothetical protein
MIKVASFLTQSEVNRVKQGLEGLRIEYHIGNKGDAVADYNDEYFEVSVSQADFDKAKSVVNRVVAKTKKDINRCPKCKSPDYRIVKKKNLFEKLLYYGATRVRCKVCSTNYLVWN